MKLSTLFRPMNNCCRFFEHSDTRRRQNNSTELLPQDKKKQKNVISSRKSAINELQVTNTAKADPPCKNDDASKGNSTAYHPPFVKNGYVIFSRNAKNVL